MTSETNLVSDNSLELPEALSSNDKTEARQENQVKWREHTNEVRSMLLLKIDQGKRLPLNELVTHYKKKKNTMRETDFNLH